MRITGGTYCNRKVECPPGIIRPAMDRMRESLFNQLGDLTDHTWLDLFTGSGCVGIEAASRGANPVDIVEADLQKKPVIEKNISFVEEEISLYLEDVWRFVPTCCKRYHYIYADPPFNMKDKVELAAQIDKYNLLLPQGLFIIHYPKEERKKWPEEIGKLKTIDERKYGRSTLRFFRNTEPLNT